MRCAIPAPAVLALALISTWLHADTEKSFDKDILPILKSHCSKCHGDKKQEGDVNLMKMKSLDDITRDEHVWFRALEQLEFGSMPPEDAKELPKAQREALVKWIHGDLTDSLTTRRRVEGRARFRRLTRAEYSNTFEDLFGIRPDPDLLPGDGRVDGYAKSSAALQISTDGAYGYYEIARDLLEKWVLQPLPNPDKKPQDGRIHRIPSRDSEQSKGHILVLDDGWHVSFNTDDTSGPLQYGNDFNGARVPGIHTVRINAYGYQTDKPLPVGIYIGKTYSYPQVLELAAIVEAPPGAPAVVEAQLMLKKGDRLRFIPFGIGVQVPKNNDASKCKGPGLALQWMEIVEPERPIRADGWLTADLPEDLANAMRGPRVYIREKGSYRYDKMSADEFAALMRKTVERVGLRILRRPMTGAELNEVAASTLKQIAAEVSLKDIFFDRITDLLVSPEFFCVVESPGELSEYALASRLSFFLWNSGPDDTLLAAAAAGKLKQNAILDQEVDRLLDDPRSDRFVNDFLDQWLDLHAISDTTPDNKLYPEYDDILKFTSLAETRQTFRKIMRENLSARDFAAPSWMLVNKRLAEHYGLPPIDGVDLRPVNLPASSPYGGLWTQAAILKVTADGTRTSPVKRGVWISKRFLGVPISPPPANIKPINPDTRGATTLRQQLALHSQDASCASCHKKFDPYGFALESFDVMGQYRANYRLLDDERAKLPGDKRKGLPIWQDGLPVDSTGVTPDGVEFKDIVELRRLLRGQPEKLAWGAAWHLATYATATPSGPLDRKNITAIVEGSAGSEYGLRTLIHNLVQNELFRWK